MKKVIYTIEIEHDSPESNMYYFLVKRGQAIVTTLVSGRQPFIPGLELCKNCIAEDVSREGF